MPIQVKERIPSWMEPGDLPAPLMDLNPEDGLSANHSFSRPSTATLVDHEGIIRVAKANELRVERGRRVENLLLPIQPWSTSWAVNSVAITGEGEFTVTTETTVQGIRFLNAGIIGRDYAYRLELLKDLNNSIVNIWFRDTLGAGTQFGSTRVSTTTGYVDGVSTVTDLGDRFLITGVASALDSNKAFGLRITNAPVGRTVRFSNYQIEDVTGQVDQSSGEYVSNGRGWVTRSSAADNSWRSVCWSPELNLFCAVSESGTGTRVMTSSDGITWTTRVNAVDISWYSVCWSPELGLFCAVAISGTGNGVMTSPDGITWTSRTTPVDNQWYSVCWSPELTLFCAVANSGVGNRVMTSPDGITWTARTSATNNLWRSVCWSPELGLFCAVAASGSNNRVMTSPDGITWTSRTSAANIFWLSVCWSPEIGLFCAVSTSGVANSVMTSPDGITWTVRTSAADNQWHSVCWSPELGLFCAVAQTGTNNRVMTSPDGITWTSMSGALDNNWRSVCWSPELGLFCAVAASGTGNRVMTLSSSDWLFQINGFHGYGVDGVKYFSTKKNGSPLDVDPYILIEKQGTNFNTYSDDLTQSYVFTGLTASSSNRVVVDTSTGLHRLYKVASTPDSVPKVLSFVVKSDGARNISVYGTGQATAIFDIIDGLVLFGTTAKIEPLSDGFFKCTILSASSTTYVPQIHILENTNTTHSYVTYTGDGIRAIFLQNIQIERASYPSSYIPTTTTPVTRTADILKYNFGAGNFPQEFCYLADFEPLIDGTVSILNTDYRVFGTDDTQGKEFRTAGTTPHYGFVPFANAGYFDINWNDLRLLVRSRYAIQVQPEQKYIYEDGMARLASTGVSGEHSNTGTLEIANWAGTVMPMKIYRAIVTSPLKTRILKYMTKVRGKYNVN